MHVGWISSGGLGSSYAAQSFNLMLSSTNTALGVNVTVKCVHVRVKNTKKRWCFAWEVATGTFIHSFIFLPAYFEPRVTGVSWGLSYVLIAVTPAWERKNPNDEDDTLTPSNLFYPCSKLPSPTFCDCIANFFSPFCHLFSLHIHSLCCQSGLSLSHFFYCFCLKIFLFFFYFKIILAVFFFAIVFLSALLCPVRFLQHFLLFFPQ